MPIAAVTKPPNYEYTPSDFMAFSIITIILCGIFSPLTLLLSLPALFFSRQVSAQKNLVAALINFIKIITGWAQELHNFLVSHHILATE